LVPFLSKIILKIFEFIKAKVDPDVLEKKILNAFLYAMRNSKLKINPIADLIFYLIFSAAPAIISNFKNLKIKRDENNGKK
ncbi:MAG: hypothetical protein ACTSR3_23685, partial [Candidatus Helarchaeota archaeon]